MEKRQKCDIIKRINIFYMVPASSPPPAWVPIWAEKLQRLFYAIWYKRREVDWDGDAVLWCMTSNTRISIWWVLNLDNQWSDQVFIAIDPQTWIIFANERFRKMFDIEWELTTNGLDLSNIWFPHWWDNDWYWARSLLELTAWEAYSTSIPELNVLWNSNSISVTIWWVRDAFIRWVNHEQLIVIEFKELNDSTKKGVPERQLEAIPNLLQEEWVTPAEKAMLTAIFRERQEAIEFSKFAHELKSPLNSIITKAKLIADLSPEFGELKDELIVAARNMLELVQKILDNAKIIYGDWAWSINFNTWTALINFAIWVSNIRSILSDYNCERMNEKCHWLVSTSIWLCDSLLYTINNPSLEKQDRDLGVIDLQWFVKNLVYRYRDSTNQWVAIKYEIAENVPAEVRWYWRMVEHIISNLINNATKYTKKWEIVVRVDINDNWFLEFSVADTWKGIPQDRLKSIFMPFTQAWAHSEDVKWTWLWLDFVKRKTGELWGTVNVESELWEWSRFTVSLPMKKYVWEKTLSWILDWAKSTCWIVTEDLASFKILVVDDNEDIISLLTTSLWKKWFTVLWATSLDEAAKLVWRAHLCILDYTLPDSANWDVLCRLAKGKLPHLKVFWFTAHDDELIASNFQNAWAIWNISKPIKRENLLWVVNECYSKAINRQARVIE